MKFKILNHSNLNMDQARPFLKSFLPFAKKKMGFDRPVSVIFKSDADNAAQPLGKTAFYDPNNDSVTVYTDGRHLKDILRSLSHELVHHTQNCRGDLNQTSDLGEDYFQKDKYMQEMEREAYEKGNMCFREWEEKHKKQLKESNYYTGVHKMKRIDSRRNKLNNLLMERFGYKSKQNEDISHLCATLVTEKSTGRVGHPINHALLEDGTVTHYDVEFDDIIVEGMPVETLDVEIQQEHMHAEDREDYKHGDKPRKKYDEAHCSEDMYGESHCSEELELEEAKDEELEEALDDGKTTGSDSVDAGLDDNPEFTRMDLAAEKGGKRGKKQANEAMIREAIRKALRGV